MATDNHDSLGFQSDGSLFRANDIRGLAIGENATLSSAFAYHLGRAFGSLLAEHSLEEAWICRDARLSSPELQSRLVDGLLISGIDVLDLGVGPTPLLCHAAASSPEPHANCRSGIMITASHNPPAENGFKIVLNNQPFYGEQLGQLQDRMTAANYSHGRGEHKHVDHQANYIADLVHRVDNISLGSYRVVIDAANGSAGPLATRALEALGLEVIPLYCEMDGRFPNHSPDTSDPANLVDLAKKVVETESDLGIAFDGDGDRMVAVTHTGEILGADRLMTLFSEDVLAREPGTPVVFDIKSSNELIRKIKDNGGIPVMTPSGRSLIQATMIKEKASFAGEFSCHFFFADKWYGSDDGIYAAARLIEICHKHQLPLAELSAPTAIKYATDEISIEVAEEHKMQMVSALVDHAKQHIKGANLVTIDGLRIEYAAGWALVRASNTGAKLTLRFEADSPSEFERLKRTMRDLLLAVEPNLDLRKIELA